MRYLRLFSWWLDDPADPKRPTIDQTDMQRLIDKIPPGARAKDLAA